VGACLDGMCVLWRKRRRNGSQERDEWVKEKGLLLHVWCAAEAKSTVNHGGVSKRDWANLHRALRGRSEGLGALVVNQNKKDLKKARQNMRSW